MYEICIKNNYIYIKIIIFGIMFEQIILFEKNVFRPIVGIDRRNDVLILKKK